jgi:hypothetical protein
VDLQNEIRERAYHLWIAETTVNTAGSLGPPGEDGQNFATLLAGNAAFPSEETRSRLTHGVYEQCAI